MRVREPPADQESYLARLGALFAHDDVPAEAGTLSPPAAAVAVADVANATPAGREPGLARVREFTAQHVKVLSALALAAVIVATWMVMQARSHSVAEEIATPAWTGTAATPEPTPVVAWMIHVVGAVVQPGVVTVPPGSRVIDAITAAGGLAPDADPGMLNLAAQLVDGCQIVIGWTNAPAGEVRQGLGGESPAGAGGAAASTINLNQATEAELDTLPGVGPVTATAILAWREKNGPFTAVAQLQEVDGIGPKTFAQIEPYVSV